MAEPEITGYPNTKLRHVESSERPFAAIVSAVSNFGVEAVQRSLDEAGLKKPDATLGKTRFEGQHEAVTIEPVKLAGAIGPDGIVDRIKEKFAEGSAVALWYKSDRDKPTPYTWTLLVGNVSGTDGGDVVQAMDPNCEHMSYYSPKKILGIIERSNAEGADGIYAYAVNSEPIVSNTDQTPNPA